MRALLDPNVLIGALISAQGAPAELISRWLAGEFELVISERLLNELERSFAYPRLRRLVNDRDADAFVRLLRDAAVLAPDPADVPRRSADPGDDYLIALAENERAILVSGDRHLLDLADALPIGSPHSFADALDA